MEPAAFRGEMVVRDSSINAWIENGRVYYRTDAVDSRGRAVDPEKIMQHELFHAAAQNDPELVDMARDIVQGKLTEAEFAAMRDAYMDAYSKVQDFTNWTEEEIEAYLAQEIAADAYAGLNYFADDAELQQEVQNAAPQERKLVNDHELELKAPDGHKVTVRIREREGQILVGAYSRGEWEAEQDRKDSLEEEPPEPENNYSEKAETFADEWVRERIEQQKEMEYEAAVDQAKSRVLEGKTGYLTERNNVKYAVRVRQNTTADMVKGFFGEDLAMLERDVKEKGR